MSSFDGKGSGQTIHGHARLLGPESAFDTAARFESEARNVRRLLLSAGQLHRLTREKTENGTKRLRSVTDSPTVNVRNRSVLFAGVGHEHR